MTCIFFYGFNGYDKLDKAALVAVHEQIGRAAGIAPETVELHFAPFGFTVVRMDGAIEPPDIHGVHMFVEWHEGRDVMQKQAIATALQTFLDVHHQGRGADLTFRDSPRGETFFLEGKLVA